jgi:hypothetical protein
LNLGLINYVMPTKEKIVAAAKETLI